MNSPSDFEITETPMLHFVTTEDEKKLIQDLQARMEESLRKVEEQSEVKAAAEASRAGAKRLTELRKAERALHQYARDTSAEIAGAADKALGSIIDSAAAGNPLFKGIEGLAGIEARSRYTARAIERLVEHLIPLAQIGQLRDESHELMMRARMVEKIAQERAEKIRAQIQDAVSEEIVLPVDMSQGVAGALIAHAGGLKKQAVELAENADRVERSYTARMAKERS